MVEWESIVGTDEMGSYLGEEYTLTDGITPGVVYTFKIRPRNKWGWGEFSSPNLEVLAASVPYKTDIAVTTIDPVTGGVKISWTAPYENGATISAYHIELTDNNGLWQTEPLCDGSQQETIDALSCIIPMDTLSLSHGLIFDAFVYVRISASNQMGQGAWSQTNSDGA